MVSLVDAFSECPFVSEEPCCDSFAAPSLHGVVTLLVVVCNGVDVSDDVPEERLVPE